MLPRRLQNQPTQKFNKNVPAKPATAFSFGIRTLLNKDHQNSRNSKNLNEKASSKMVRNSARNGDENNNRLFQSRSQAFFCQNPIQPCLQMQNQNLAFKQYEQNHRSPLMDFSNQQKVFSDQIGERSNFLKLNNITNIYSQQRQNNLEKKDPSQLYSAELLEDKFFKEDNQENDYKIYVDMAKRIKKLPKRQRIEPPQQKKAPRPQVPLIFIDPRTKLMLQHQNMMRTAFLDELVLVDAPIYRSKIINQRIDNDVDTDQEQIACGMKKLARSLEQAVKQNQSLICQNKIVSEYGDFKASPIDEQFQQPPI